MKNSFQMRLVSAITSGVVLVGLSPTIAAATPSWSTTLTNQNLTITVTGGELTYALNTSLASLNFVSGQNPSGSNISAQNGFSTYACSAVQTTPQVGQITVPSGCERVFGNSNINSAGATNASTQTINGSNLVQSRVLTQAETSRVLASGYTYLVAYVEMREQGGVATYVPFSGRLDGTSNPSANSSSDEGRAPGVAYAGPLVSAASGRSVIADTPGTLNLTGKRLNQVTTATIGGVAVTITSSSGSALTLSFKSLPAGKQDVILKTKTGSITTLRNLVHVD